MTEINDKMSAESDLPSLETVNKNRQLIRGVTDNFNDYLTGLLIEKGLKDQDNLQLVVQQLHITIFQYHLDLNSSLKKEEIEELVVQMVKNYQSSSDRQLYLN